MAVRPSRPEGSALCRKHRSAAGRYPQAKLVRSGPSRYLAVLVERENKPESLAMDSLTFSTGQDSLDVLKETSRLIAVNEALAGQERPGQL